MKIAKVFERAYALACKLAASLVKEKKPLTFEFQSLGPKERMRELVLYIVAKCGGQTSFGKTKLNKILFLSDFYFFADNGVPVTGASYRKDEFGPVPSGIESLLAQMECSGELVQKRRKFGRTERAVFTAKRPANLDDFTAAQISQVDRIIDALELMTSSDASDLSHTRLWEIARMGEQIPYEAALISDEPPTVNEIARAKELCSQYGWEN